VAEVLRGVRASDMGFRIADDRFAVLLPNTPYGSARTVVERAAAAVGGCGLPAGHVHVDAGVAEATSADPPALLTAAGQSVADARERRSGLRAA
jgi:GGDEF domain-containing protein